MAYVKTHGVVLRCIAYSETSQVAAIATPDMGQVHVLAKGSHRPRKDGRTPLDVLTHCDLVLATRTPGHLHILTDWSVRDLFAALRTSLRRFWAAFYADEAALACTSENPDDGPVCDHLLALLRQLECGGNANLTLFLFLTRLLRTIGSVPITGCCAHCRSTLGNRTRFSPQAGGALCEDCLVSDPSAFSISLGALAVMTRVAAENGDLPALRMTKAQTGEIQRAFNEQIQYHLGRPLHTARFLTHVY